jgi:predicted PhzF superfamily epimerase YddE/YHI9
MSTYPYVIINAFTRTSFGGNPAVIIALPPNTLSQPQTFSEETMIKTSLAFAQPMAVFLSLSPEDSTLIDVRFYLGTLAPLICGHATLAAVKALCTNALPSLGQWGPEVKLRTKEGLIISARSITESGSEEDKYEITLPATPVVTVPDVEIERIASVFSEAAGRNIQVEYAARGEGKMSNYLMVIVGPDENVGDMKLDCEVLVGTQFHISGLPSKICLNSAKRLTVSISSQTLHPTLIRSSSRVCLHRQKGSLKIMSVEARTRYLYLTG